MSKYPVGTDTSGLFNEVHCGVEVNQLGNLGKWQLNSLGWVFWSGVFSTFILSQLCLSTLGVMLGCLQLQLTSITSIIAQCLSLTLFHPPYSRTS